ncbi:hypothetical protein UFOVP125_4 [uncultured Caudovirales phage]|uniref:Uncharacterized protein n=1 Tax=uncultured Caudovirales phage TaxID=2100421 RepID=A0A6J5LBF0_9CAUD|nr:hypothetical protein UFOVP125_4 [uncultured Caudovirales phage]
MLVVGLPVLVVVCLVRAQPQPQQATAAEGVARAQDTQVLILKQQMPHKPLTTLKPLLIYQKHLQASTGANLISAGWVAFLFLLFLLIGRIRYKPV